jgi:hypothetical protein
MLHETRRKNDFIKVSCLKFFYWTKKTKDEETVELEVSENELQHTTSTMICKTHVYRK